MNVVVSRRSSMGSEVASNVSCKKGSLFGVTVERQNGTSCRQKSHWGWDFLIYYFIQQHLLEQLLYGWMYMAASCSAAKSIVNTFERGLKGSPSRANLAFK